MTLTDRCWETDFLLYPTDICLSPPVCSWMDQIGEDVSQMLDWLLTTTLSYTATESLTFSGNVSVYLKNKSNTFGIRIPYRRILMWQKMYAASKTDVFSSLLWFSMFKAIIRNALDGKLSKLHCRDLYRWKPILIQYIPTLPVTKWVLNHLIKAVPLDFLNEGTLPSGGILKRTRCISNYPGGTVCALEPHNLRHLASVFQIISLN